MILIQFLDENGEEEMYDESLDGNMDESNHMVYVMKRSGERVPFDLDKIIRKPITRRELSLSG